MKARYVANLETLFDPDAPAWRGASAESVQLMGTPIGLQPTAAVRASWMDKAIGNIDRVGVRAAHDGRTLAFRLEWSDPTENREISDNTSFPDAAAVLRPAAAESLVMTMGAPGAAVNAWYWRADDSHGRHVVAEGLGTSRTLDLDLVKVQSQWKGGRWRVVIARAMQVKAAAQVAQLKPGEKIGFAVAIWEGAHSERAGIKAFSGDWRELRIDSLPTARK